MIIPKAITVGPNRFEIRHVKSIDRPPSHGRIDFVEGTISLAAKSIHETRYTTTQRRETFWHEVLHACLCDMGRPLRGHDEDFIDALAKRITQVCDTAEV